MALFVAVLAISGAVGLPATLYSTFVIETRFGFNRTSPGLFMLDQIKGMAVGLVLGVPLLALVLWLFVAAGAQWWLWTWLVWSGFSLAMMWLFPTVIAPVFNRFEPLQDGELKQRIDALLARCGFRSSGVFVVDGSKRSSHGNAYFTGFGAAKRIVFYDTLIRQLDPDEIEAVLAHELGHFRLRHVAKRITVTLGLALVLLWILGGLAMLPAFYAGLGVATPSPAAALLLFMLVVPVLTFPFTPLASWSSRQHEFEADAFAAGHASAACLVSALTKLYRDNASTLTPDPLYSAFYDSHPPAAIRIQALENLQPG